MRIAFHPLTWLVAAVAVLLTYAALDLFEALEPKWDVVYGQVMPQPYGIDGLVWVSCTLFLGSAYLRVHRER